MEIIRTTTLSLSGILLFFVGFSRLSNPIKTYLKSSGIKLENDVNLLNEMRGVGSLMLCAGIIVLLGTFVESLSFTSLVIGTLMFLGFLIGRLVGMNTDGKPNKQISQGMIFELILGTANLFCIIYLLL